VKASLFHVDAFTSVPFAGNPAAVLIADDGTANAPDDRWLQAFAAEMNLSETAFPRRRDDGDFDLRWFTPAVEVDLCGHATLATAHVLWTTGRVANDSPIRFQTRSGVLTVGRHPDGRIELDFPAFATSFSAIEADLTAALGLEPHDVHHSARSTSKYHLIVVTGPDIVRKLRPDFGALRALGDDTYVVTAPGDDTLHDVVSRYFAPAYGIDEDPATGAAHCVLAPYWSERLARPVLRCYQASERGAELECEPRGDRVLIRGHAVTVYEASVNA
jgi:PhzF family phenazine biosynthesis protein